MNFFENQGIRGTYLTLVYKFLKTILPTSVESKRAFLVAKITCTKQRTRMNDDTIDIICFVQAYFLKQRQKKNA